MFLLSYSHHCNFFFFFFNDTATTEIYTLSLHDALPISPNQLAFQRFDRRLVTSYLIREERSFAEPAPSSTRSLQGGDRKSTRLNSSHSQISYAVFCLKKKKTPINIDLGELDKCPSHPAC